jgi:mannose-1-phosphate guanylyltransferase
MWHPFRVSPDAGPAGRPSDRSAGRFAEAVTAASALARTGKLVTFGIVPNAPETGFGYIESGAELVGGRQVRRFVEKPDLDTARGYLEAGNFYWNSGMFCFSAGHSR